MAWSRALEILYYFFGRLCTRKIYFSRRNNLYDTFSRKVSYSHALYICTNTPAIKPINGGTSFLKSPRSILYTVFPLSLYNGTAARIVAIHTRKEQRPASPRKPEKCKRDTQTVVIGGFPPFRDSSPRYLYKTAAGVACAGGIRDAFLAPLKAV